MKQTKTSKVPHNVIWNQPKLVKSHPVLYVTNQYKFSSSLLYTNPTKPCKVTLYTLPVWCTMWTPTITQ